MNESFNPSSSAPPLQAEDTSREQARAETVQRVAGAAVALTPLALLPGVFVSHDVIPKVILLTSGAGLLLLSFGKWSSLLSALWRQPRGRHFLTLAAAQCLSLLLSTAFSPQVPLSLVGTAWRRFGLIEQVATLVIAVALTCAVAARDGGNGSLGHGLFRAMGVCGALAAIYGILQYFGMDPLLERKLYTLEYFGGITRPPGSMGQAIYFSAYLAPVLFIAVLSAFADPVVLWRRIQAVVAVLCAAAILLSASRGGMAGALAGGILFGWSASGGRIRAVPWKYAAIATAVLLALPAFVLSPAGENLRRRVLQWGDDFGGARFAMWRECVPLIAQQPILGEGPDRFAGEFRKVQSVELSRRYPDFYNETPHNAFFDAACAQGIPGLMILAGVFLLPWSGKEDSGLGAKAPAFDPVRSGLQAAMLAILITSIFASLTLVSSLYLWSIAGLFAASRPSVLKEGFRRELRAAWFPATVCGALLLAAGAVLATQDVSWAAFERAVEEKNFAAARKTWSRAASSIGLPGYELWASRQFATLGLSLGNSRDTAEAWKLAAAAAALAEVRSEEQASAAYQSAVLAVAAGDLPMAEWKARETIRLAPNWYRGHQLLSQVLQLMHRTDESTREALLSATLGARVQRR